VAAALYGFHGAAVHEHLPRVVAIDQLMYTYHIQNTCALPFAALTLQRFRAVRPLVDSLLQGYDTRFLGLLEDASDGVGLWSTPDLSAIGIITNPTFPSLLKLIGGLKILCCMRQAVADHDMQ
jgi:hypothetical protein